MNRVGFASILSSIHRSWSLGGRSSRNSRECVLTFATPNLDALVDVLCLEKPHGNSLSPLGSFAAAFLPGDGVLVSSSERPDIDEVSFDYKW